MRLSVFLEDRYIGYQCLPQIGPKSSAWNAMNYVSHFHWPQLFVYISPQCINGHKLKISDIINFPGWNLNGSQKLTTLMWETKSSSQIAGSWNPLVTLDLTNKLHWSKSSFFWGTIVVIVLHEICHEIVWHVKSRSHQS